MQPDPATCRAVPVHLPATGTIPMLLTDKDHDSPEGLCDFLVVAPRTNHGWEGSQVAAFVKGLLDAVTDPALEASIDPGRIVVSGVSMGGAGAWRAAEEGLFAAVVPICAAGEPSHPAALRGVGIWAFHAANDVVIDPSRTDGAVQALKAAGVAGVKYTRFKEAPAPTGWPGFAGHASWVPAYRTEGLFPWMKEQRRPADADGVVWSSEEGGPEAGAGDSDADI